MNIRECESEDEFRSKVVQDAKNILRDSTAQLKLLIYKQPIKNREQNKKMILIAAEEPSCFKKEEEKNKQVSQKFCLLYKMYQREFCLLRRASKGLLQTSFSIKEITKCQI
ncbi:unnamed protein product [Paramecium sonneborni]|uniref:Uncharacterized protein n=1 Tax=Paramecium sonneborni TaxID=65129 RepID=A0A8S1MA26_9CILI|nr:unnamed protein product [Paramecium sonneborni]